MIVFTAVHDETKETLRGSAKEISEILGVSHTTIYKVTIEGKKVLEHWEITKEGGKKKPKQGYKAPVNYLAEWDRVTKPFKEASKRKGKHEKNNIIA